MQAKHLILLNLPKADQLRYRRLIRGMQNEVKRFNDVRIWLVPFLSDRVQTQIKTGTYAGMITEGSWPEGPPGLLGCIPMVGVRHPDPIGPLPRVLEDPHDTAQKVLAHFQEEGLHTFGVFHNMDPKQPEGRIRSEAFLDLLRSKGLSGSTFPNGPRTEDRWSLEGQLMDLEEWLNELPKPCGVLCGDDAHAHRLLMAVEQTNWNVPDDLAILGHGNDLLYCATADESLSSVDPHEGLLGEECVRRLMEEIEGRPRQERVTWLGCTSVIRRKSTDRRYGGFPFVKRAVQLLEEDLPSVASAQQLAEHLHISHTALNTQFRAATGKSTWAFVKGIRIEKSLELLQTTDLTLAEICAETGISTISQLSTDIRKYSGKSPRELRK